MLEKGLLLFSRDGEYNLYDTRQALNAAIDEGSAHSFLRHDLPDLGDWVGRPIARGSIRKKQFLSELKTATKPLSSWVRGLRDDGADPETGDVEIVRSGLYQEGTGQLRKLMRGDVFPNPKPPSLVRNLLRQSSGPNDVILDFFAGSGTTAQAVMELNGEDGLHRRFVMVSHDEATEDEPDRNLTRDVLAERIRRLNARNGGGDGDPTPFAYLRTRLIPTDRLLDGAAPGEAATPGDLLPEDVWLAVQAMHALPISPFIPDRPIQIVEDDALTLAFCDTVTDAALDRLRAAAATRRAIHCYCWTPGPVRRALEGADAEIHRLPSALWDAFRS
jgi:adenine-specific DNA-methyltransferase